MDIITFIIGCIVGSIIGALITYLITRARPADLPDPADHPLIGELRTAIRQRETELSEARREKEGLIAELASSRQVSIAQEEKLAGQVEEITRLRQEFHREFQVMATTILDQNAEKHGKQNKEQIDQILTPLRERIREFEQKIEKTYDEEKGERIRLKKEIEDLVSLNKKLSEDAENLTTALRGDNKTQGNWGELILEKILERSGLKEGVEYRIQHSTSNSEGARIRPDVVIFLPDDKHLIIDSKVSLLAYSQMVGAADDDQRNTLLRQHLESVKAHIKGLGEKNYQSASGLRSPDFIMLFLPMEAAFSAALQADPDLFSYAWERRIVIVSPTTLLATLRTVENIWRQEKRSRSADLIAEEAGKLYDKFAGFTNDLYEVGKKLDSAKEAHEESLKKLVSGAGNVIKKMELIRGFASKTSGKTIHPRLLERSEAAEEGSREEENGGGDS